MKKIIFILLVAININATAQQPVADTIPLLTIKDYQLLEKHLEDKLLAKDYKIIMNALNELYGMRVNEYLATKKKEEPVAEKKQTLKTK